MLNKLKNKFIALLALLPLAASAQDVPAPAPAQSQPIVLKNAVIHIGNGQALSGGAILFDKGKIVEVASSVKEPAGAKVIDLGGKHVYPGIIAPMTTLGLEEVEAVRATRDYREVGAVNPNPRTLIAYNTDSRVTPTVRSNGILLAQVVPAGDLIAGTGAVVQLDAWTWEDAAYLAEDGVHLYWPSMSISNYPFSPPADEQRKNMDDQLSAIQTAMDEARNYLTVKQNGQLKSTDLRWEAMIPVLLKSKPIFIYASSEKEITAAVAFALRNDVRMVLVSGEDAWLVTDLLRAHDIPVILNETHSLPRREEDPIDINGKLPLLLKQAGIKFCLMKEGFWDVRNLPFVAGTAAAYGLDREEAVRAITLSAAEILGISDRTGSLEMGKDANIVVSTGDLLDMRTANVEMAFIQGRQIDLGNKQKDLYKKFRGRKGNG